MALPTAAAQPAIHRPPIETPSWIIMGPSGTGKSYCISTLLEAGLEVFMIGTEPDAISVVLDVIDEKKLPMDKFHWKSVRATGAGMAKLIDMAKKVKALDQEGISKLSGAGISKDIQNQYILLLQSIQNFVDDKDGQAYGDATEWGDNRVLVIDSLSGLNQMVQSAVIGLRPTSSQGEWQIAQNTLLALLMELTSNCKCFFLLTAHIDREPDEITGSTKIMVSTLGKKLAPKITPIFSEIVLTVRDGTDFYWSTASLQADTKARALEWSAKIKPSFVPLVEAYRARVKAAAAAKLPEPATLKLAQPGD